LERRAVYTNHLKNAAVCQHFFYADNHWNFGWVDLDEMYIAPGVPRGDYG